MYQKRIVSSVADPHLQNADPGENLNADADPDMDLCPY
jgi:hypothetical protein